MQENLIEGGIPSLAIGHVFFGSRQTCEAAPEDGDGVGRGGRGGEGGVHLH